MQEQGLESQRKVAREKSLMLLNRESADADIPQWEGIRKLRCTTLIFPTLEKQRQTILSECDASPAYIEFQASQGYKVKPCLQLNK